MFTIPAIDMAKTGQNIRNLRIQAGFSVKDLQGIFSFSTPQALYKWQQGVSLPTIDNMVVLAALFGVKVDDILVIVLILLSLVISRPSLADLWKNVSSFPCNILFALGIAGFVVMGILGAKMSASDKRANWIEQIVNLAAQ